MPCITCAACSYPVDFQAQDALNPRSPAPRICLVRVPLHARSSSASNPRRHGRARPLARDAAVRWVQILPLVLSCAVASSALAQVSRDTTRADSTRADSTRADSTRAGATAIDTAAAAA